MKILLPIIFGLITLSSFGQSCDTIVEGEKYNCIDKSGLKQGTWLTFSKEYYACFDTIGSMTISSTGNYIDGRKEGKWIQYPTSRWKSLSWIEQEYTKGKLILEEEIGMNRIMKTTNFFEDGSWKTQNYSDLKYEILCSTDSVCSGKVTGIINQEIKINGKLSCEHGGCILINSEEKTLATFNIEKIDSIIGNISYGYYIDELK